MADQGEAVSNVALKAFLSASNYENIRHDYAFEAVEFLLHKLGLRNKNPTDITDAGTDRPCTILELGCGTGKFTRVMLKVLKGKNVKVIASEPLTSMCEQFRLMVPDTEIIQCAAEKIRKFLKYGSAHVHESKYFFTFARHDPSLFNLIRCL